MWSGNIRRVDPAFNGEATSPAHIERDGSADADKIIYAIETECSPHHSSRKRRSVTQYAGISIDNVIGVRFAWPPTHDAGPTRRKVQLVPCTSNCGKRSCDLPITQSEQV